VNSELTARSCGQLCFGLETKRAVAVHLVEPGDDRAYRASVSGYGIDLVTGGAFTLTALT